MMVWKKNMPENSNLENPIYHIIRALSLVPSHLAEFYSHKEWCLALVIFVVMERPVLWIILWIMLMLQRHVDTLTNI